MGKERLAEAQRKREQEVKRLAAQRKRDEARRDAEARRKREAVEQNIREAANLDAAVDQAKYGAAQNLDQLVKNWIMVHRYVNFPEGQICRLLRNVAAIFPGAVNDDIAQNETDLRIIKKAFRKMMLQVNPDRQANHARPGHPGS